MKTLEILQEEVQKDLSLEGKLQLKVRDKKEGLVVVFFEEKEEGKKEKLGSIFFELVESSNGLFWELVQASLEGPQQKGKGLGRALLKAGIKLLSEKEDLESRLVKATVVPDERSENEGLDFGSLRKFYEALGFEVTKESPAPHEGGRCYLDIEMKL